MSSRAKACIIGAGCSGFSAAKALQDIDVAFDCFEMSDQVGGNWCYKNKNGLSACYESLHIDTSKYRIQFEDFPIPAGFPDFPHHSQVFQYFNDYVDHHGLRSKITFETKVERVTRLYDGRWQVEISPQNETRVYDDLFVCNGHHWKPRWPEPAFEGHFNGVQMHAHSYLTPYEPHDMTGKNVVIVGMGNSAVDLASELGQRVFAKNCYVAARRGVYVFPKTFAGKPLDKTLVPGWIPPRVQRLLATPLIKRIVGNMEDYGLPKPEHEPLAQHPTVSGEFLNRVSCGDVKIKPNIRLLDGDHVVFDDGSREAVDVIIYATGYDIAFPFLDESVAPVRNNHIALWKRMMRPEIPNLFFLGLAQPLPTLIVFAELQMKLIKAYIKGQYQLPSAAEMERVIEADEDVHMGHFYPSPRHTMQVDFSVYRYDLAIEIQKGMLRAKARPFLAPLGIEVGRGGIMKGGAFTDRP